MAATVLRVRARQGIVSRFDLDERFATRKVGMRLEPHADSPNGFAWAPTGETEEVPNMAEFRTALKDGALWAADEATAREVWPIDWRDNFDPSFGTAKATKSKPASAEKDGV